MEKCDEWVRWCDVAWLPALSDPSGSKEVKKKAAASTEASYSAGETTRRKESPVQDGRAALPEVDSAEESTDTEEAVSGSAEGRVARRGATVRLQVSPSFFSGNLGTQCGFFVIPCRYSTAFYCYNIESCTCPERQWSR